MSSTSRTGLVPTPKKQIRFVKKLKSANDGLPSKFEAVPMTLSLRPFGGLFNPFARGCSVLCNHPAPSEVKDIINQLKSSLAIEGKNVQTPKDVSDAPHMHETDNIPEDLFRRYADTDSRPLTPSPTVTSVHTRTSAGSFLNNRRCITPELGKNEMIKRKKIILDLRRSHSQETLYWKPSSDISQSGAPADAGDMKPKSAGANEELKAKRQKSGEQRPKSSLGTSGNLLAPPDTAMEEVKKMPQTCINEHDLDDEDMRRGKKRKKLKPPPATATFHLSEDPETQVATLGPDSLNPSTRPSLIPNSVSLLPGKESRESDPVLLKGSFLTDDAFQALKTELDVDVIENTFERYLNRALREAIKYIPAKPKPIHKPAEELSHVNFSLEPKMPRKFSKSATRFDVPLDMKLLEGMTVLDYLSKYVWVSRQRKQLFKRVFVKYINKIEDPELTPAATKNAAIEEKGWPQPVGYVERTMPMEKLTHALADALEFYGTPQNISEVLRMLDFEQHKSKDIGFRAWCGIAAFAERLALDDPAGTDSCDELEKIDFLTMEQRFGGYNVAENLREVFDVIMRAHRYT